MWVNPLATLARLLFTLRELVDFDIRVGNKRFVGKTYIKISPFAHTRIVYFQGFLRAVSEEKDGITTYSNLALYINPLDFLFGGREKFEFAVGHELGHPVNDRGALMSGFFKGFLSGRDSETEAACDLYSQALCGTTADEFFGHWSPFRMAFEPEMGIRFLALGGDGYKILAVRTAWFMAATNAIFYAMMLVKLLA